MNVTPEEGRRLLELARQSAAAAAGRRSLPAVRLAEWPEALREPLGAFVTLHHRGRLRGCIGRMTSRQSLPETVVDMAAAAAVEDPRFPALRPEELGDVRVEISVLSPLVRIQNPEEIQLGRHGVLVQQGRQTGVFLPQVATETGWNLETFLSELCRGKAGLEENAWQDPKTALYTFTAQVIREEESSRA